MFKELFIGTIAFCIYRAACAQCSTCTSCSTSSVSGCTYTVSSNSATNYTVNFAQKLCITGGTYTGKVTFNGGTTVVDNDAVFNPVSTPFSGTSILEIKSGASAFIPGLNISSGVSMTLNNCGTTSLTAISKVSSSGTMNINNKGTMNSTSDFQYSSGSSGSLCNSGTMTFVNLSMSTGTNSLINNGRLIMSGDMVFSNNAKATICQSSYTEVDGNWSASGGATMNAPSSCGQIKVKGTTNCSSCSVTGYLDICDSSGTAPNQTPPNPKVDNNSGGSWGSNVSYCTCNTYTLPVMLVDFRARAEGDKVTLEWETAVEINNNYFTVEKSSNGWDFTSFIKLKGGGNSSELLFYSAVDDSPVPGVSYYRLRQTDFDGHSIVFIPVAVNTVKATRIYPNPAGNYLSLYISSPASRCAVEIYDVAGKEVFSAQDELQQGLNTLSFDLSVLGTGVYIIRTEITGNIFFDKFIKGGD